MAKREKFGKFVLLDEIESSGLGMEYRAAKLGAAGLEKVVALLRLSQTLSGNADVAKHLMDQAKAAAQLQNPNIAKIFGIGKVDSSYYISYEFIEGKSLKSIFSRCRRDGFPFSVDHTLLIASKICSALEYAHARKTDSGARYYHGLVNPASIFVSYEGEVRVRGFGYWPSKVREAGALREEETMYLSPEQAGGGSGDTRSDTYAVGVILFETLTGQPLGAGGDVSARLAAAKLQSPTSDDDSLPKPIAEILARALAQDPNGRYVEIAEMRKAIDTLLFSGDFTPTTFNLAFFMHSLFREDIDKESKQLKDDKEGSYFEFLTDDMGKTLSKTGAATVALPTPPPAAPARPAASHADATIATHTPVPVSAPAHEPPAPQVSAKEAAAGFTFHKDETKKSKTPLFAGAAVVLLLLGVGGYFMFAGGGAGTPATTTAPAPTTLSPEAAAAAAKMRELEEKLKALEDEKAAAEQKAADEAKKKLEAQAKAAGTAADPAAIQKAQEEAAKKARAEQEKKQQEERQKVEAAKAAEEARLAEEQRKADEAAKAAAAAAATTLPPVTAPPTTVAPVKAGTLVNLTDAGVTPPIPDKTPPLVYPPIALRQHIEGTVELSILVDDKGAVTEAQIVASAGGRSGLDEAAVENAKRRRYRPATRDGVPVKVWMPLRVVFTLPKS